MLSLTGNKAKNGYLRFVGDSSAYTGSFSFAGNNAFPISLIPAITTTMPLAEFSQRMIILAVEVGACGNELGCKLLERGDNSSASGNIGCCNGLL